MRQTAEELLKELAGSGLLPADHQHDIGRVVNDAKVTDHHALLPTGEVTPERMDKLKGQQQDILKVVISSFGRATAENYEYTATEVLLDVEGEAFKAHGQMVRESGWRDFDTDLRRRLGIQQEEKDQEDLLPRLHVSYLILGGATVAMIALSMLKMRTFQFSFTGGYSDE